MEKKWRKLSCLPVKCKVWGKLNMASKFYSRITESRGEGLAKQSVSTLAVVIISCAGSICSNLHSQYLLVPSTVSRHSGYSREHTWKHP